MSYIRSILAPVVVMIGSGLTGCSTNHDNSMERTKAAEVHLEKLDDKVSRQVVASRLAGYGRYLAQGDSGVTSSFNFEGDVERYFDSSSDKNKEYTLFLTSKAYLEESRKNNTINSERYNFFNGLFKAYEEKDLISYEDLPTLGEIRNAVYEKEYIDSAYACWAIDEKEYAFFNSQKWIEDRRPLNEVKEMLTNLTSAKGDNISKELRAAFIFSKDYNVANKIFEVFSKGFLSFFSTIKLLTESNNYFQDLKPNFSSTGGMRAQFLLKFVFPEALKEARDSKLISDQEYNDLYHKWDRDVQDEKNQRRFSHLTAEVSCLLHFRKLGFQWEKEYNFGNRVSMAQLAYPSHEPFDKNYNKMVFIPPSYNNQEDQTQVLSGN